MNPVHVILAFASIVEVEVGDIFAFRKLFL